MIADSKNGWVPVPPRPELDPAEWHPYSTGELAELKPWDKVYGLYQSWQDGGMVQTIVEASFMSYSPGRGIVELLSADGQHLSYCDKSVGFLCEFKHSDLYGSGYEDYEY
jgi:hypothetical protein